MKRAFIIACIACSTACPGADDAGDAGPDEQEPICAAEARRCRGTEVQVCSADGLAFDFLRDCASDGLICVDGACGSLENCGNAACEVDENCSVCPGDCGCEGLDVCIAGVCEARAETCGDAVCDSGEGENCGSCGNDCGCPPSDICEAGACVPAPIGECGDGVCAADENCTTCDDDCGCASPDTCVAGTCTPPGPECGDGVCDGSIGEDCESCVDDCGCDVDEECAAGQCVLLPFCGDGTCDAPGEDCATCDPDCGCTPDFQACVDAACVDLPPPSCPHPEGDEVADRVFDAPQTAATAEMTFNARGALAVLDGESCVLDTESTTEGKAALEDCTDLYRCGSCTVLLTAFGSEPPDGTWRLSGHTSDINPDSSTCAEYQSLWDWDVCVPKCEGRVCGDDGCGFVCGACGDGLICDEPTGQCVVDVCGNCLDGCSGQDPPIPGCCTGTGCLCEGACS